MLRKLTVLTLAAALLIGGADSAFAQGRGGRGGGGGGGGSRGWSGGGGRGWNGGGWNGNHNNGWGGFGTGLAIGAGLGYGLGGYGYGYGGYPYSSGYYDGYYGSAPVYVDPGYTSGYVAPSMSGATGTGYMAAYPPTPAPNSAMINMRVPPNAKVFFGDTEGSNTQVGTERHFVSPPLDPGSNYQYQLRAQWMENGQMVNRTRTVDVHANQTVNVDFTQNQNQ